MAKTSYDWKLLPLKFHYLIGPAEKYGVLQFDDSIVKFLKQAKKSELELLSTIAKMAQPDSEELNAWIDSLPITENSESRVIYFLFHLIFTGYALNMIPRWRSLAVVFGRVLARCTASRRRSFFAFASATRRTRFGTDGEGVRVATMPNV